MSRDPQIDTLLERAAQGDSRAREEILARHEKRLKRMVAIRMDPRLGRRFDASDVVQDAYIDAWQKLPEYLESRRLPFYPWLRQIVWERLISLHRAHLHARKRSVKRERGGALSPSNASNLELAARLAASGTTVSARLVRQELTERLSAALDRLRPADHEILVLRFLEQLSIKEVAAVLDATEAAVKVRQFRAVSRLQAILEQDSSQDSGSPAVES